MHEAVWTAERALAVLEHPGRTRSENPRSLWRRTGLAPGMTVVDVGAGSGFFTFPASQIVGPEGKVYAVDVSPELIALIRERARTGHRANVEARVSRPGRIPLRSGVADRVLLANVLHGVAPATVRESVRLLRPDGHLIDLDWKKEETGGGPPVGHRLDAAEAKKVLEAYGLRTLATWEPGPSHYAIELAIGPPRGPAARRTRG